MKRLALDLPRVDVPEPNWFKVKELIPNHAMLVTVMNHGSLCMAYVAGNILAVSSATEEQSRSLLESAVGVSLWSATEVVRGRHPVEVANALILERLEGAFPHGAEYLFKGLQDGEVASTPAVGEVIRRGLASVSPTVAVAAAKLAGDLAERGQPLESKVIVDFYDDWMAREPEQESGAVPPSPRETLLKLLISQNALDNDRLLASLSDARSDVRGVGKEHMLAQIATSQALKNEVVKRILSRSLPPATAGSVLQGETPLADEQILALKELMNEQDPKWRRVGVELLRQCYLSDDEISEHVARLLEDTEEEIRQAALQRAAADKS